MKDLHVKGSGSVECVTHVQDKPLTQANIPCHADYNNEEELNTNLLLKESPTVMFILNLHTRECISVSDNITDLIGIRAEEITSKDIGWVHGFIEEEQRAIYKEEMLPLALRWFKGLAEQGKNNTRARLTYKLNIITKGGKPISTLHVLRPLTLDESGMPILAVEYVTDITPVQEVEDPVMILDYKEVNYSFERIHYQIFRHKPDNSLSIRQNEIVRMIQNGYSSKRIADELCLSIHTINNHRKNIIKKYGIKNLHSYQLVRKTGTY